MILASLTSVTYLAIENLFFIYTNKFLVCLMSIKNFLIRIQKTITKAIIKNDVTNFEYTQNNYPENYNKKSRQFHQCIIMFFSKCDSWMNSSECSHIVNNKVKGDYVIQLQVNYVKTNMRLS